MKKVFRAAVLLGALALLQACATAHVDVSHQAPTAPPKFDRVAVLPFDNGVGDTLPATAPDNVAGAIVSNLQKDQPSLFKEVVTTAANTPGELVVKGKIMTYNAGSKAARFILIGLGAGKLELDVSLLDGGTGNLIEQFSTSGSIVAGGVAGAAMGIDDMIRSAAKRVVERLVPYGQAAAPKDK